jgi:hypothetical protein
MDRLRTGAAIALAAAAGVAGVAVAATNGLEGKIKGDSDSKVTAKVLIEDRVPTRVLDLKLRKVDFDCGGGRILQGSIEAPDRVPVRKNGNFETESKDIDVKGTVKLKGRKIVGSFEAEVDFEGDSCDAKGEFKARE